MYGLLRRVAVRAGEPLHYLSAQRLSIATTPRFTGSPVEATQWALARVEGGLLSIEAEVWTLMTRLFSPTGAGLGLPLAVVKENSLAPLPNPDAESKAFHNRLSTTSCTDDPILAKHRVFGLRQSPEGFVPIYFTMNDPYAGSPTKTLLRLLLPTNDKI
ncbi:MAG: hypothetical protein BGO76_04780 [Caedibacter sp. 38-128]|nr:MAG: hypothetical protein BGO76_04780 [Caedibacter sp. 38-128]